MTLALLLCAAVSLSGPAGRAGASNAVPAAQRLLAADGGGRLPIASRGGSRHARVDAPARSDPPIGILTFAWSDEAVYRLTAAPERVSDIALQPGESLISVASGDTARWVVGETSSGAGAAKRVHVLVKPSARGLETNLLISTDRRLYRLELSSRAGPWTSGIAWTYPADALLALKRPAKAALEAQPVAEGVGVENLNFAYSIGGDRPSWRPVRAFDDGHRLYIQFPPGLAEAGAPPLFGLGSDGRPELLNYRLRGLYYVVDGLPGAAELRLGGKRQQVVRISRDSGRPGQARGR